MIKEELVKYIVEKIRPYLNRDGGDLIFVKMEDNIAYLSLIGACVGCGAGVIESEGIKELIMEEVVGLKEVVISY